MSDISWATNVECREIVYKCDFNIEEFDSKSDRTQPLAFLFLMDIKWAFDNIQLQHVLQIL